MTRPAYNRLDRTGQRYGKLTAVKRFDSRYWECECECGNSGLKILSTNLSNYARNNRGCRFCANRKDITGEKIGVLTAVKVDPSSPNQGHPIWIFKCDCGNEIKGTVREFHAQWLRSCGCHDNAYSSWVSMMARCYEPKNNRYSSYGGRGITVCKRWHKFKNFVADMGERPKRHSLGRRFAEAGYSLKNCKWEHISKNCRDTKNDGTPTVPGLKKKAKIRVK